jgi:membrane fusion protein (multidrug efflux system)
MVISKENTIETRPVKLGQHMGDMVLITEGLKAGEKVVIDALQKVQTGMPVNPVPAEFQSKTSI